MIVRKDLLKLRGANVGKSLFVFLRSA